MVQPGSKISLIWWWVVGSLVASSMRPRVQQLPGTTTYKLKLCLGDVRQCAQRTSRSWFLPTLQRRSAKHDQQRGGCTHQRQPFFSREKRHTQLQDASCLSMGVAVGVLLLGEGAPCLCTAHAAPATPHYGGDVACLCVVVDKWWTVPRKVGGGVWGLVRVVVRCVRWRF